MVSVGLSPVAKDRGYLRYEAISPQSLRHLRCLVVADVQEPQNTHG
jgi:hypothetical protein